MSCPEGSLVKATEDREAVDLKAISCQDDSDEGDIAVNYSSPKNWKKSFVNLFRQQNTLTKVCEGNDKTGSSLDVSQVKDRNDDQPKWQSLGKMFRRQSLPLEHYRAVQGCQSEYGESSSQSQRVGIKKRLTRLFQKSAAPANSDPKY